MHVCYTRPLNSRVASSVPVRSLRVGGTFRPCAWVAPSVRTFRPAPSVPIGGKALFVVPVILTAMVALWAVECNRMVRASFYIATELWDRIRNDESRDDGWETWIRRSDGIEGRFRKRQHHLQKIVTLYLPCGLTAVGFLLSLISNRADLAWFLPILALALLVFVIWVYLLLEIPKISDLGSEWTRTKPDCIEATNNPMDRSGGSAAS